MELQPLDILLHIINIVILYVLLRVILFNPVSRFLRKRTENIQKQFADAEQEKTDALKLKESYEQRMQHVDEETTARMQEALSKADNDAADLLKETRRQADQMISDAGKVAEQNRVESVRALQQQITDLSVTLAGEILKREITEADNRQLIDDFFAQVR